MLFGRTGLRRLVSICWPINTALCDRYGPFGWLGNESRGQIGGWLCVWSCQHHVRRCRRYEPTRPLARRLRGGAIGAEAAQTGQTRAHWRVVVRVVVPAPRPTMSKIRADPTAGSAASWRHLLSSARKRAAGNDSLRGNIFGLLRRHKRGQQAITERPHLLMAGHPKDLLSSARKRAAGNDSLRGNIFGLLRRHKRGQQATRSAYLAGPARGQQGFSDELEGDGEADSGSMRAQPGHIHGRRPHTTRSAYLAGPARGQQGFSDELEGDGEADSGSMRARTSLGHLASLMRRMADVYSDGYALLTT